MLNLLFAVKFSSKVSEKAPLWVCLEFWGRRGGQILQSEFTSAQQSKYGPLIYPTKGHGLILLDYGEGKGPL